MSGSIFDDEDDFRSYYTFTYRNTGENKTVEFNQAFEDATTWPTVLNAFIDFLSSVYGYNVGQKVRIEKSPFNLDNGWSGAYFSKDDKDAQFKDEDSTP